MANKIFPTDTVAKSPLVGADLFLIADSADSNKVKDVLASVINTYVRGAGGSIIVSDGEYVGLDAAKGRIAFTDAAVDLVTVLDSAVVIGTGTPGQAQVAEDLFVSGKMEVDGIIYADESMQIATAKWIGIGSGAGRMLFTDGTPDLVNVLGAADFLLGDASEDCGYFKMIKGAQTGDPQVEFALSADDQGHFQITTDTGTITLATPTDSLLLSTAGITLTQNSDTVVISHDGTDAYTKWSDGYFYFMTDEGTNTTSGVRIKGKGTGEGVVRVIAGDDDNNYGSLETNGTALMLNGGSSNTEFVINDNSRDMDTRIESNNQQHMWYMDAGNDKVGIVKGTWVAGSYDGEFNVIGSANYTNLKIDTYSTANSHCSILGLRKFASNTIGTKTETVNSELLGLINFQGADTGNGVASGAVISCKQDGTAGVIYVPANIILETYSATAKNSNQLVLHNDGLIFLGTDTAFSEATGAAPKLQVDGGGVANRVVEDTALADDGVLDTLIDTGYGMLMVTCITNGESGIYRIENQTIVAVSQNANFTTTKDNAGTINVYFDTDGFDVQNKDGGARNISVAFYGT